MSSSTSQLQSNKVSQPRPALTPFLDGKTYPSTQIDPKPVD